MTDKTITVLSFDPGIDHMGWSVLHVTPPSEEITVVKADTLSGREHYNSQSKDIKKKFKRPFVILQSYYKTFKSLMEEYNPDYVVTEGAFAHTFIAAAFSLIVIIHVLRQAACDALGKDITQVAPMTTKKILTGVHDAKKDLIYDSVHEHKDIILPEDTSEYTEHSYDAIGHGYAFIQMCILHPEKYPDKPKKKRSRKK